MVHLQVVFASTEMAWLALQTPVTQRVPCRVARSVLLGLFSVLPCQNLAAPRLPMREGAPCPVVLAIVIHVLSPVLDGVAPCALLALVEVPVCHEWMGVEVLNGQSPVALEAFLGHEAFS
jgi:hypothetical protein